MPAGPSPTEVRQRMARLRADLHRSAEGLKHDVRTLTDWRYHVRQHPWLVFGASGLVAFLAVPRRTQPVSLDAASVACLTERRRLAVQSKRAARGGKSLFGSLVTMAGHALLRSGLAYLGQHAGQLIGSTVASRSMADRRNRSPRM
jgi:hypothetical protein